MSLNGELLKRVRIEVLLLSQEEAADELKVTRSTIQRWERDESRPQPIHHRKLYEVYGIGLRQFGVKPPYELASDMPDQTEEIEQTDQTKEVEQTEEVDGIEQTDQTDQEQEEATYTPVSKQESAPPTLFVVTSHPLKSEV